MHKYSEIVSRYAQVKVLVVGDAMMDQYHFGRVERLSPEAPVPVFIEERQKGRPGGAANVVANLIALGCQVKSVMNRGPNITMKHRYMVGHHHLFRVDRDVICYPTREDVVGAQLLCEWADVVILSDYAKGWLTHEMCQSVIEKHGLVVIDPKGSDWQRYRGAEVLCPNSSELAGHGDWTGTIIEKRGAEGLRLVWRGLDYPAQARAVFDVTGAGDTVVAVVAATLGACGSLEESCVLANAAAGVVVGKVGTSECSAEELLCALDSPTVASTDYIQDIASSSERPASTVTG